MTEFWTVPSGKRMTSDTASLDYSLNIVRREFSDEFPDLALVFIACHAGAREEALQKRQEEILEHPAGRALWPKLKSFVRERDFFSDLAGFARADRNRYFNLVKKEIFLAVLFVNADEIRSDGDDAAFLNKNLAYALGWQALWLREAWKKNRPGLENHEGILSLNPERAEWLRQQMMADCFAAMMLETKGEKGAISRLLKRRCELSILPAVRYRPENFPFPVALDATHLVYKDLRDTAPPGTGPLAHAYFMAQEIGQTYDDMNLKQWAFFCRAAQEMAWAGHSKNEILGAAVYASDDPYVRSTGYIVAETLNTDPIPLKHTDFYNPFADDDANERLHARRCRGAFDDLIGEIDGGADVSIILKEVKRQNAALLNGDPAGWCALALLAAHGAYRTSPAASEIPPLENARAAFFKTLEQTGWPHIRKLHRLIVAEKRKGVAMNAEKAAALTAQQDELAFLKAAFEIAAQHPASSDAP